MEYLEGPRTAVGDLWVGVGVRRREGPSLSECLEF